MRCRLWEFIDGVRSERSLIPFTHLPSEHLTVCRRLSWAPKGDKSNFAGTAQLPSPSSDRLKTGDNDERRTDCERLAQPIGHDLNYGFPVSLSYVLYTQSATLELAPNYLRAARRSIIYYVILDNLYII